MLHSAYLYDLIIYFLVIFIIAYFASRVTRNHNDFILGGRRLNSWFVALGAGASDMSGWLLMALPGDVFVNGLTQIWMPVGLLLGAYLNWKFIAKKLRVRSEISDDASTIPAFIENAFHNTRYVTIVTTLIIIFFFSIYVAAGFVSSALLFQTVFDISYHNSVLLSFALITLYTFIGGFLAVSWIDFFQGSLMLFALLIVPISVFLIANHHDVSGLQTNYFNAVHGFSLLGIISLLGWGLGYFGQPHILVRFMAINDANGMKKAMRISLSWMFLCLIGALLCGVVGRLYYGAQGLSNPESVFLSLSKDFFNPIFGGILFAAVLSAVMSTIAAQLLISSSALAEDILVRYCFKKFTIKQRLWFNRFVLVGIAFFAMLIARSPNSNILKLVSYAWAGLGASFGPLIIMLVYQRKVTEFGAMMGILVGAVTVVVWRHLDFLGGIFSLYEIIPGFIFSWVSLVIFSRKKQLV